MDQIKNKSQQIEFVKVFSIFWLATISLSPYFLFAFALAFIDFDFSFSLFRYLVGFLSFPILPLIIIVIFKKELPPTDRLRNFIALNAKKFFWTGVASFYLTLIVSLILGYGNFFEIFICLVPSTVALPILAIMLKIGLKFYNNTKMLK